MSVAQEQALQESTNATFGKMRREKRSIIGMSIWSRSSMTSNRLEAYAAVAMACASHADPCAASIVISQETFARL